MEPRDLPRVVEIEDASFSDPWSAETFRSLVGRSDVLGRVLEVGSVEGDGAHRRRRAHRWHRPERRRPPHHGDGPQPGNRSGTARPDDPGVGSDRDRKVVGHGVLWLLGVDGELANLAVAPDARGRGRGGRFLDALMAEAKERGVRTLFLEVRDSNEPALALYRSRGFMEIHRRRGYYRRPVEDARVLMTEL